MLEKQTYVRAFPRELRTDIRPNLRQRLVSELAYGVFWMQAHEWEETLSIELLAKSATEGGDA